jgi:hypothetical protein
MHCPLTMDVLLDRVAWRGVHSKLSPCPRTDHTLLDRVAWRGVHSKLSPCPCTDHTLLDRVAWRGVRHCRTNILSPGTCGDAGSQNPTGPNATCYTCWKADGQGKCTVPIEGCQVVEECGWPLMMSEVWGRYPCESNPHPLIRHEVHRFKRTHSALPTTGSASVRSSLPTSLEYLHLARGFEISSAFACLCLLLAFEGMCL